MQQLYNFKVIKVLRGKDDENGGDDREDADEVGTWDNSVWKWTPGGWTPESGEGMLPGGRTSPLVQSQVNFLRSSVFNHLSFLQGKLNEPQITDNSKRTQPPTLGRPHLKPRISQPWAMGMRSRCPAPLKRVSCLRKLSQMLPWSLRAVRDLKPVHHKPAILWIWV